MSETLRLDDQLCFALYAAMNAVTRQYRPLLRDIGLTYPQYLLMLVLWQDGPRTVQTLAQRLDLPANAMTPLLDRLETLGYVLRVRDGRDRRVVNVSLTNSGTALEHAAHEAQKAVVCRTGFGPNGYAELRDDLKRLVDRIAERSAARLEDLVPETP